MLTLAIFLPIVGAILIALFLNGKNARTLALITTLAELALTSYIFLLYDKEKGGYQLVDKFEGWIPFDTFRVDYFLGIDGLSAPLVLLTGILGIVAVFASWSVSVRMKEHFMWLLVLQGAVIGVFTSLDFFLFFLFWELELIPMFFLISIWGTGRKEYSAMKFIIFTILGSAFLLIGILSLYFSTNTFDMTLLPDKIAGANLIMPASVLFFLTIIGFAIKLPVFPFHTWLPDAHTDAPTAASVMLAGVLLKMGGYGMFRVSASMFPEQIVDYSWLLATLGLINILYGAAITIRQTDLKRLIAYSSVSHMGFVLLGIAAAKGGTAELGMNGAALQMFTHGTITGLLFLTVGFIYEKAHTRYIPDLGGLANRMPFLAAGLLVAGLASLGLPGTSGFVAEITIFMGSFPAWHWFAALAAIGVVLTAGYILWMIQRVMFGPQLLRHNNLSDASIPEMIPVAILVASILVVGIYPAVISDVFNTGLDPIVGEITSYAMGGK
ncbi:MAG: NADH-quinone oxidoreductase subunit M [SAR202 cluster bacterium]|nr:NADH-quinone oxidoreductase subunit M [SAR202 cluster bacterium AD-802-K11_MRT_200m]MQG74881.1 NADH-quinone oxidoreductase subunit M [SAR202 cluster bacterium]